MTYRIPDQSHLANRKSKKVLLTLPPAIVAQLDWIAHVEQASRSELIREAIRRWLRAVQEREGAALVEQAQAADAPTLSPAERKSA